MEVCCANAAIPARAVDAVTAVVAGEQRELQKVMRRTSRLFVPIAVYGISGCDGDLICSQTT